MKGLSGSVPTYPVFPPEWNQTVETFEEEHVSVSQNYGFLLEGLKSPYPQNTKLVHLYNILSDPTESQGKIFENNYRGRMFISL